MQKSISPSLKPPFAQQRSVQFRPDLTILAKLACALSRARALPIAV
jgi:hypothetical protein